DFSRAIFLEPKNALVWSNRGATYRELHQDEKALADLDRATELRPRDAVPWIIRGQIYTARKQWDKVIAHFSKLVELDANNPAVRNHLAWLLDTCPDEKFQDPGKAVELAKKAVEMAPKEGTFCNTLGVAQYRAGDWKAAVEALKKSEDLLKDNELSFNAFFL